MRLRILLPIPFLLWTTLTSAQLDLGKQFNPGGWATAQAKKELLRLLAKKYGEEAPTVSSAKVVFETVPALPGGEFKPGALPDVASQLAATADGSILLLPGDYEMHVRCNCMKHYHATSPAGHLYILAPIIGKRAAVIATLNARAAAARLPAWKVQQMSWNLQAGLRYDQLPEEQQKIADQYLLPKYKSVLDGGLVDEIRKTYNTFARTARMPSFDTALSQGELKEVGMAIQETQQVQQELANSNNEQAVAEAIARPQSTAIGGAAHTPWSIVCPRVYGRMFTDGCYQSIGTLQIRVLPGSQGNSGLRLASFNLRGVEDAVSVPVTSLEGEPQNEHIQPLSMVPQIPATNNVITGRSFDPLSWIRKSIIDSSTDKSTITFITSSKDLGLAISMNVLIPTQSRFTAKVIPLEADGAPQSSIVPPNWFDPVEYSTGFTASGKTNYFVLTSTASAPLYKWTIDIPPQEDTSTNSNGLQIVVYERSK